MTQSVELLVAEEARGIAVREFGQIHGVVVRSAPSTGRSRQRLVLTTLKDFQAPERLTELEEIMASAVGRLRHADLPVVLGAWGAASSGDLRTATQLVFEMMLVTGVKRPSPEPYVAPDKEAMRRLLNARLHGAEGQLIASAHVLGRQLLVWSCEPKLYRISADRIPALAGLHDESLRVLAVSPSGSRIHWEAGDVDISLDTIREQVDPVFRKRREQDARRHAARFASAIRALREENDLGQSDVAGLSEREVRRIEKGEVIPHAETLRKLAAAHDKDVREYLDALARRASTS